MHESLFSRYKKWLLRVGKKLKPLRLWWEDNELQRKLFAVGLMVAVLLLLWGGTKFVPQKSNYTSTKLNEPENVGEYGNTQMAMTSRQFNAKKHFMIVKFHVSSQNGREVDAKNIKFEVKTVGKHKVTCQMVPLVDNNYILILSDLKPGYRAIQLRAIDKLAAVNQVNDDTGVDDTDSDSLSSSSESSADLMSNKDQGSGKNDYKFIINEDTKFVNNKLTLKSQTDYVVEDLQSAIQNLQRANQRNQKLMRDYQTQMAADKKSVSDISSNQKYSANKDAGSQKIDSINTDYQEMQGKVARIKKNISDNNKQISLYRKQISDVKNGKYKLPDPVHNQQLK